jgi:hypothetical protein
MGEEVQKNVRKQDFDLQATKVCVRRSTDGMLLCKYLR